MYDVLYIYIYIQQYTVYNLVKPIQSIQIYTINVDNQSQV